MDFIEYLQQHLLNLSLFGVVVLVWLIVNNWINKNLERVLKQKGWIVEGRLKNIKKLLKQVLLLVFSLLALESLLYDQINSLSHQEIFGFDYDSKVDGVYDRFSFTIGKLFYLIFVIVISKISLSLFRVLILRSTREKKWIDEAGTYSITQLSKYVIYLVAVIVAVQGIGIDITFLTAGVAAVSLGLTLSLQNQISDVFSGIILLFDGSIKVGDVVEMPNHEICKVDNIFIRTSQLKTLDGKTIIVPNNSLTSERVINWTISDKVTRFNISVGVGYGSDTKMVKEILYQSALKHPLVEKRRNITIELEDFGDHALRFNVYFWAQQTWEIVNIKSDIRLTIDQAFRNNKIKIPYPQRDLHIVSDSRKNKD